MSLDSFLTKYKLRLTDQQRKAVESIEGPTLLLAVPGSGKTTVLVTRLGYMIYEKHIPPKDILTLTYTVSATRDMSDRFVKFFGDEYKDKVEFRTINGVCAKIINYYSRMINKPSFELDAEEKSRNARISKLYREIEEDFPTDSEVREIGTYITYIKNTMLSKADIHNMSEGLDYDLEAIYNSYVSSMREEGLMDYDDQMVYAYNILRSSEKTLKYFQNKYKYICLDEAQDTSRIQHTIISLLASDNGNLFYVGDEDQSIYSWRAADVQGLLNYEANHEGAQVLVMEENFRSNAKIVSAADRFIQRNTMRHKKNMRAFREPSSDIKLVKVNGRQEQYSYLFEAIRKNNDEKEIAVLYKNNESIIPLIDRLDRAYFPFKIKNAELLFFTNRVVVDVMDILRFVINPKDEDTFMRIYYKIGLYIGKEEATRLCKIAKDRGDSIIKAGQYTSFNSTYSHDAFKRFKDEAANILKKTPFSAVRYIVDKSGYSKYLERNHMGSDSAFVLGEIARLTDSFSDFFKRFDDLQRIIKENKAPEECNIIFSTIHSSKGLEYEKVYLIDIIDGIFPDEHDVLNMNRDERAIYEEERRVFYVGITRAKDELVLFDVGMKSTFVDQVCRSFVPSDPSGFVKKIPKTVKPDISFTEYCEQFSEGDSVIHDKFGKGTVNAVNGPYIKVQFGTEEKTLGLPQLYAKGLLSKL